MNGQNQSTHFGNQQTTQNILIVSIAIITTGMGMVIGHSFRGKSGTTVGGIAGAIAGSLAGYAIAEFDVKKTSSSNRLDLGADTKNVELPAHYSWEELKVLSQPSSKDNSSI